MTIERASRERVRTTLSRLRDRFGIERRIDDTWTHDPAGYEWIRERHETGTVGGAGAWIANDAGEVLLVRHEDHKGWSEPAGKQEPGEDLAETARREVTEETSVACTLESVQLAQVIEHVVEADPDRPPISRLIVTFRASHESGEPVPEDGEIAEVGWFDAHPEMLAYDALTELPIPAAEE